MLASIKKRPNWQNWNHRDRRVWLNALAAEGLQPEDVDIVMCKHLHADHVGWNIRLVNGRWTPTFLNCVIHALETSMHFGAPPLRWIMINMVQ